MRVCGRCGSEYKDAVTTCADCGSTDLRAPETTLQERADGFGQELDTRKFVRAATAEDPLSSEKFQRVLEEAQIPVFVRPRRAGIDGITGSASAYWEILVPEESAERAAQLLGVEREQMESSAEDNARAAELEEAETHDKN